ncbi:tetratricopeptide repeat protein [Vibrio olivae]|uniref:Tetratricopeptide repeat protein n=1 Tax=Vibrio olivae TaxID=1243002 RepID=A0ABV5HMV2_9VIBR
MDIIGMAIGAAGLTLLSMFAWMLVLSLRKKRLEEERKEREIAYRKAIEKHRKKEHEERLVKAENGHVPTILFLAKEAERTNIREALHWYGKAAALDNVTGMYGIVRISAKMSDDMVLKEQAKYWKTCIAAMEGNLEKKYQMGQALYSGRGVAQDVVKALEVITEAAERGHVESMLFLGDWFRSQENSAPDPKLSLQWYKRAAAMKSNPGRMKYGLNFLQGVGAAVDFKRGIYWLERAAEKGHTEAMYQAGEAWIDQGPHGNALAYIWLFMAAQLGHVKSRRSRDQVALTIGVDTVVGLQALSKPMLRKLRENKVNKHALIRALNRLYKRDIPLYESSPLTEQDELMQGGEQVVADAQQVEDILEETNQESTNSNQEQEQEDKSKLDFSNTSMDKPNPS